MTLQSFLESEERPVYCGDSSKQSSVFRENMSSVTSFLTWSMSGQPLQRSYNPLGMSIRPPCHLELCILWCSSSFPGSLLNLSRKSFISSSHITNWRSSHCHFSSSGSRVCNELHLSEDAKCLLVWTLILFRKYLLWFFYIFKPLLTVLETIVSRYLCVLGISVLFLLPRVLFCARRTYDMLNLTQKLLHKMDLANLVSLLYIKYFKKTKTHWSNSQL